MIERDWTPRLSADGQFYCSPACGGGKFCRKEWHDHAVRKADELVAEMGPGWSPRVFENLGWHWSARRDGTEVVIHATEDRRRGGGPDGYPILIYTCYLNVPAVIGGTWSHGGTQVQFIAHADNPTDALGFAVQDARTCVSRITDTLGLLNG